LVPIGNCGDDTHDGATEAENGTEESVVSLLLGPMVHLVAILLVHEDNGDIVGFGEQ
jgi:hypothetical protein